MEPRIETLTAKKLVGKRMIMSFSNNQTGDLWKSFMQRRKEIQNSIGTELYSMQIYSPEFFDHFNPNTEFEKWATVEVTDFKSVPHEMETYNLKEGLYAVFTYKGASSEAGDTFQYIFENWLPNSDYFLDNRPHFELLGEKYKKEDPNSEEEIWVPIMKKH